MAASSAESAMGVTIAKGATGISECRVITGPAPSREMTDVTHHESDDDYHEYIPGLKEGGEISLEGNLLTGDTGQMALITDFEDGSLDEYTITLPNTDASTWVFNAYVSNFEIPQPQEGALGFKATLKISGKPTFTV